MGPTPVTSGTAYDEVPYESNPYPQSHPDRLATVATMAGFTPPPVEQCRILELGCASGGNILPMAVTLPSSTFLGIDLSLRQITQGQKTITELGLRNVELRHLSILDVTPELGQFDYIICHGIYSWVPAEAQNKILTICKENLAPNGVAYVSYNTYPGWHMRGIIREMMSYHGNYFATPQERLGQARALLDFVAKAVANQPGPYSSLLQQETNTVRQQADYYLLHEHLEPVNDPLYFHQFAGRASARGLRYLGEAEPHLMASKNFPPEVRGTLNTIAPDIIRLEQYMDFLRNRMFRQTLLCHAELIPNYLMRPEQITSFLVAAALKPVSPQLNLRSTEEVQFQVLDGTGLRVADPLIKTALVHTGASWPQRLPFAELCTAVCNRLGKTPDATVQAQLVHTLGSFFLEAVLTTPWIQLHVHAPPLATRVSDRPLASPLARFQAATGKTQLTNLHHQIVSLSKPEAAVLSLLDGQRERPALIASLRELVEQKVLVLGTRGKPETDSGRILTLLREGLEALLPRFARMALLMG
jgi:methyltransferase-like protein/2-polyprenyl-3-methyl-5-hydroxy-6-metoxy-1,4-benzoquinol methylase